MDITFLLNGERVDLRNVDPTMTALDWLRNMRGLTGTKEGCNEGDCGACTVLVSDSQGTRALNSCILFLPQLNGKALRTVEGISGPNGQLHPVQQALIDHHGSQCGFCTPGFVSSMAAAHMNGDTDHETALSGNLCRCTGYAPILRAARAAEKEPTPEWLDKDRSFHAPDISSGEGAEGDGGQTPPFPPNLPKTTDELAAMYAAYPDATLVAGATDVGLWVTKQLRQLDQVIFLGQCADLQKIDDTADGLRFGAGVTMDRVLHTVENRYPSYAAMLKRYASAPIRTAATIGGNIANGSPIGDNPPALIALGASLQLRQGDNRREVSLEDFFIDYGKQDLASGEFVEAITIPAQPDQLRCYKISKRFDQDISAVLGCFNLGIKDGIVHSARIAFGGMAGIPKRATHVEKALIGAPWTEASIANTYDAWPLDFTPMSDMRASDDYRLCTARNLLTRYFHDLSGTNWNVKEVTT